MPAKTTINYLHSLIKEKHVPSLDGLRAVSIIMVIISHVANNFPDRFILKLNLRGFGVNIFFVISGFLITFLLLKERQQNAFISLKEFYIRRALRIIPVAYIFILSLLILKYLFQFRFEEGNLVRATLFYENIDDHSFYTSTTHYWSLSVEEQFYLLFPVILSIGNKVFLKIAAVMFLITPVIVYANYHLKTDVLLFKNVLYVLSCVLGKGMLGILTGCITAILVFKFSDKLLFQFKNIWLLQLMLFIVAWVLNIYILPVGINSIASSVCIALLLITVINNRHNFVFRFLNFRIVAYIGTLSYSLYIWQQIFCFQQPWASSFMYGRSVILNMLLLFITAILSYHLYEKQFLKLKSRFTSTNNINKKAYRVEVPTLSINE